MAIQSDTDHLTALRELCKIRAEHLDLPQAAVKEQERLTRAVDRVVVAHAVDQSMAAPRGLEVRFFRGWRRRRRLNQPRSRNARGKGRERRHQQRTCVRADRIHVHILGSSGVSVWTWAQRVTTRSMGKLGGNLPARLF